jgi:lipopolysaccharide transport system ATP-binding protein
MKTASIRAEGLGKRYRIERLRERHNTLRDTLASGARSLARSARARLSGSGGLRRQAETFWALRDVSLDVAEGEAVGIIGANGAGKSTLLKVLSRITEPTTGWAEVRGRVGSLLEVGTGFHSELSGRENIYLSGAILGMRRAEIDRKFDEIVAFAEVEPFLETPVKRYSSGMYLRLAFAVAAHLEPEILLIDEVLAVGDAEFQKKCLGRMSDVARQGRTVLFVSHNLVAVEGLCRRVVWLRGGEVAGDGPAGPLISEYLRTASSAETEKRWDDPAAAPGDEKVRLRLARIRPEGGAPGDPIDVRTPLVLEFESWNRLPGARLNLSVHVYNEQGVLLFNAGPLTEPAPLPSGLFRDVCHIPGDLLNDGRHSVELLAVQDVGRVLFKLPDLLVFDVRDSVENRGGWYGKWAGAVRPLLPWSTERLETPGETP